MAYENRNDVLVNQPLRPWTGLPYQGLDQVLNEQEPCLAAAVISLNTNDEDSILNTVERLLAEKMQISLIASQVGMNERQLKYFMKKHGLRARYFDEISNDEIDVLTHKIVSCFPTIGYSMFLGHFRIYNLSVQRSRLYLSLDRVKLTRNDPPRSLLTRRIYVVKAPMSVWHMDGYHGLIRYRFVIHGCVDGYSRLVTFLTISNNNRATTVLHSFQKSVIKWGMPVKVRSDKGMENVAVCDYMLAGRGLDGFLTGRSVHNQRIERLWRDAFEKCISPFYFQFGRWEEAGILEPGDEFDLYCLHFVCMEVISTALEDFTIMWNNHKMRTHGYKTPRQILIGGLLRLRQEQGYHPELIQDEAARQFAESEALILGQVRNDRNERRGIIVPPFMEFLTPEESVYLRQQQAIQIGHITLDNMEMAYRFVKEQIILINQDH